MPVDLCKFVQDINRLAQSRSPKWPSAFGFGYDSGIPFITLKDSRNLSKRCRELDPWGLIYLNALMNEAGIKPEKLIFKLPNLPANHLSMESLRRRLAFLNLNNKDDFSISLEGMDGPLDLPDYDELFTPESKAVLHDFTELSVRTIDQKGERGESGYLEKVFQLFLCMNDKVDLKDPCSNERLAILGEDFYRIKSKNSSKSKGCKVLREFNATAFNGKKSRENALTPQNWIDLVSINRDGQLAVIELKIDDSAISLISQALDYALFFARYKNAKNFSKNVDDVLGDQWRGKTPPIVAYMVANYFHPKMEAILPYYATVKGKFDFELRRIHLGAVERFVK